MVQINKLTNQKNDLVVQINALKAKEEELETDINKLADPEYIAKYAREKYLYSRDGEFVIKLPE